MPSNEQEPTPDLVAEGVRELGCGSCMHAAHGETCPGCPPELGCNHPLAKLNGKYAGDPHWGEYLEEIRAYREDIRAGVHEPTAQRVRDGLALLEAMERLPDGFGVMPSQFGYWRVWRFHDGEAVPVLKAPTLPDLARAMLSDPATFPAKEE